MNSMGSGGPGGMHPDLGPGGPSVARPGGDEGGPKIQFSFSVPANIWGLVIGEAGETAHNINQQSGAAVEIAGGAPPNPPEKIFINLGNPQQIEHAEQLITERVGGMPSGQGPHSGGPDPQGPYQGPQYPQQHQQPGPSQPHAPVGWAGSGYRAWPDQPQPCGVPLPSDGPAKAAADANAAAWYVDCAQFHNRPAQSQLQPGQIEQQARGGQASSTASNGESNPPVASAASKRPSEDSGESPREKRPASTTASAEKYGRNALHLAAGEGNLERARELIGRGADTRLRDRWGMTPLHRALDKSEEEVAELLADADCGIDVRDDDGRTPLHRAAAKGYVAIVGKLLEGGARTRVLDERGMTPLHWALDGGKLAAAQLLADADCEIDCQDDYWRTPLFLAAGVGHVKIIKKLLAAGARLRVQDKYGMTPLHHALHWGKGAAAEFLTEADGGNDVRDGDGNTPLQVALLVSNPPSEYEGIVRKLLRIGVNPHLEDRWGDYPVQVALGRWGCSHVTKMLLSSCALRDVAIDWEELRLCERSLQFCIEAISRCDVEIERMKRTRVPGSSVSYHHLVTRHVSRVAPHLRTSYVRSVSRRDFPCYADLISSELRTAERRRDLMDRCLESFSLLSLSKTCADIVLLCLSEGDMANFVRAVLLVPRSCRECGALGERPAEPWSDPMPLPS